MIYSLSIAEAAENDIRDAFMWYEEQKEGLGKRFEEHITKAMESIRSSPVKTQIRYNNTRIFFQDKFPFGIHFQIIENQVLIVAVFHTSRDTEK
jgi:plasmid stabilization system protein ParE